MYPEIPMPCNPSPCGENAICRERNGVGSCSCMPEFPRGDPYSGCRPICITNNDCDTNKACVRNKCVDPCINLCGINAQCKVVNHSPQCSCIEGFAGNALRECFQTRKFHYFLVKDVQSSFFKTKFRS